MGNPWPIAIRRGANIPNVKTKLDKLTSFLLKIKLIKYIVIKYACSEKNSFGFSAGHLRVFPKKYKRPVIFKKKLSIQD